MVLEDVTELQVLERLQCGLDADMKISDYSGGQTKLPKILLNGNNICMVSFAMLTQFGLLICLQLIPGGEGPGTAAS